MGSYLEEEEAFLAWHAGIVPGENTQARRQRECNESMVAAAAAGHCHIVVLLIRNGADVNGKDRQEQTALMRAVSRDDVKIAKFLLRCGCDVNVRGINGDTALNIAIRRGAEEMFRLLIRAGADIFLKKWDGKDAWDIAGIWKRANFTELLDEVAAKGPVAVGGSPLEPGRLRRRGREI